MIQSDAQRLTARFIAEICESPFAIAPERVPELLKEMGGVGYSIAFTIGSANFTALPQDKKIEGTYAALLSLWAVAASVWAIFSTARLAKDAGCDQVDLMTLPSGRMAMDLKEAALNLIRDPSASWDIALPEPDPGASSSSMDGVVNNLFFGAVSFVILHEIGHLVKGHQVFSGRSQDQEREADEWATCWILESPPSDAHRDFRSIAICIAFLWIGLIDEVRRAGTTHPPAHERLGRAFNFFDQLPENAVAYEAACYAMKAYFDPDSDDTPPVDDPIDGFISSLVAYSRRD